MQERRHDDSKEDDRDDRRVDLIHPEERDDEHDHAGDGGDPRLDEDRDRDERAVRYPRAPRRDDARRPRP
jgi:hypothetical protein